LAVRLAALHAELSAARARLSIAVADYDSARAAAPTQLAAARARLAAAIVLDRCAALDRAAELPALARNQAYQARRAGAELVTQADSVASVAARLAAVLRGEGTGFRGDLAAPTRLAGLGPNETDESLILAAENVSLALSLAARLVLVLARRQAGRGLARRLAIVLRQRAAEWAVRVASLPLLTDLVHRCLGSGALLPCAVLLGLALIDRLTGTRVAGRPRRSVEFTNGHLRPRHTR
jgi:hypothetical protein